jgi:hypothetical protein
MPTSFSSLKKNSASFLDKIKTETDKLTSKKFQADTRFWEPEVDPKTGNGSAIIRFLPPPEGEDVPWTRVFRHSFQGPTGKWFIQECPTTINNDCPICNANSVLWDTGLKSNEEIARKRKRQLSYISNIVVISDPNRRDNEGKVFLFKYGKKIFDKINGLLHPEFDDETPTNPFDFWTGANFKLKIRKVEGYRNYDKSDFETPSELFDGVEDRLMELYKSLTPLAEFTKPELFKGYDELKAMFNKVWSASTTVGTADEDDLNEEIEDEKPAAKPVVNKSTGKVGRKPKSDEDDTPWDNGAKKVETEDDEDDAMARFRAIANED